MSMFVNDIKIMDMKKSCVIAKVKAKLTAGFSKIDIGSISFYLGLKVKKN